MLYNPCGHELLRNFSKKFARKHEIEKSARFSQVSENKQ